MTPNLTGSVWSERLLIVVCSLGLAAGSTSFAQDLPAAPDPADLQVADGFTIDLLYTVPKDDEGSWVGLTYDPKGRLIATDQYGDVYRITLPGTGTTTGTKVEALNLKLSETELGDPERRDNERDNIVGAHGALYAFDSLYLMVSENYHKQGIWRLRDTTGDDQFDEMVHLRSLSGRGEHGPHSLVLGPDGNSIYIAAGNFTDPAPGMERTLPVAHGEDHLLPRMWDARGHARERYAPGGWVARMDPDGEILELFAQGFRNQFDIAFDANGELFTFDSDMEWDIGMPWYMPTRINHIVSAGDYGWRSGAGRWPDYYPDSLPAVVDIGPSSPTGTIFGTSAKFPAKYQRAMFAADWTYGTLYAIHLAADGATFTGEKEEFIAGKPLPLTDLIVNPHDGAMYFLVGGRRTQSALYRVTYSGAEETSAAPAIHPNRMANKRKLLEELHAPGTAPDAIDEAWLYLDSSDRFLRWAARTALERQNPSNWAERALAEEDPAASIEALIALARVGPDRYQSDILDSLADLKIAAQSLEHQYAALRAWQLAFTRMGSPSPSDRKLALAELDDLFPQEDAYVNRLLVELLVYLDSPTVVAKTVPLLKIAEPSGQAAEELGGAALIARNDRYAAAVKKAAESRPDRQQIAYAYALRHADAGWTPELRHEFFSWFTTTHEWQGGASFPGFMANIRKDALDLVTDKDEQILLADLSKKPVHSFVAGAQTPKGPGKIYTVDEAMKSFQQPLKNRKFRRGKDMFAATACIVCHRFNYDGGGIGPDLTGAGSRYTIRDLLESIIEPSKVVSDIYEAERFETENGNVMIGQIVGEEDGFYQVMVNPFAPDQTRRLNPDDIVSRTTHDQSLMPPGLLNSLNGNELRDLIAYVISGGNPEDPMFAQKK
ncbi:c-type cytochrome [Opitutaceae bacterium]|nr:c-type cytochrome [Opitutaceae bacterium]